MLRIGVLDSPKGHWLAKTAGPCAAALADADWAFFANYGAMRDALLGGGIQAALCELKDHPVSAAAASSPVLVAAISSRERAGDVLFVRPSAHDSGQPLQIQEKAAVAAHSDLAKAQLLAFRPDLGCKIAAAALGKTGVDEADALLLGALEAAAQAKECAGHVAVPLPERDFLPAPGQGAVAWLAHREDSPTRSLLKKLHRPEVSACTNVERRLLRLAGPADVVGAWCERDTAGNYHAFAARLSDGALRRARLSSSTHLSMSEKLWELLSR